MKNLGLKSFSVICAVGLSFYVQNPSQSSVIGFVTPIEFKNIPENKMLISPVSPQARVTIRGPSRFVQRLATSKFTFKVVAPERVGNRFSAALHESDLGIPEPVQVLAIDPPELIIVLDDKISRDLPVMVPRIGSLSEELKLQEMSLKPAQLRLTGARSEIERLSSIETEALDFREVRGSTEERVAVRLPSPFITADAEYVFVKLDVISLQKERRYEGVAVELRDTADSGLAVEPKRVNLELSGSLKAIESLADSEVVPYVRLREGAQFGSKVKVSVDLPRGVSVVMVDPQEVSLIKGGTQSKAILILPDKDKKPDKKSSR